MSSVRSLIVIVKKSFKSCEAKVKQVVASATEWEALKDEITQARRSRELEKFLA